MALRERLREALTEAMRARDPARLSTFRLVNAAIRDREIAQRGEGGEGVLGDAEILAILGRLVRQRQESARAFEEGGRLELAEKERAEIAVIEEFLPRPMDAAEIEAAVAAAVAETGATGIRDMGRVMALLKARHAGRIDLAEAGARVKARLG